MKKMLYALVFVLSVNLYSNVEPPSLSNFKVFNRYPSRVYFDSSESIVATNTKGFRMYDNRITGIKINSGKTTGHYFVISKSLTHWDNVMIRYTGGSDLKDSDENDLEKFTLQYIINEISEPQGNGKIYYVSTSGSDRKNGLSKQNAWKTIKYAATKAQAGDIVYIKAGNYGSEKIVIKNSGRINNPIKFIGYKRTPGDIDAMYYDHGDAKLDPSEMPLLNGSNTRSPGIFTASVKYCIVRNIQITKYLKGIYANDRSNNNIFENLLIKDVGVNSGKGYGIILNDPKGTSRILNTTVINATESLVRVKGDNNLINNFKGYCDVGPNNGVSTDYYISMYEGSFNVIRNSYLERVGNIKHTGHGISLKANGIRTIYNLIEDNHVHNIEQAVELRHEDTKYNVVRNVLFTGEKSQRAGGLSIRDNTSSNSIENCTMDGLAVGLRFTDNPKEEGTQSGGHHNKIINTVFTGCDINIMSRGISSKAKPSKFNYFLNCTFYDASYMFSLKEGLDETNRLINCNIVNVENLEKGGGALKMEQTYNNYYNGFSKPDGKGNVSLYPKFMDPSNSDFRLKANSPLINKGKKLMHVSLDNNGQSRAQGSSHDIGAFEYRKPDSYGPNHLEEFEVCAGEEIKLTASSGKSYEWNTGEKTRSITVSSSKTKTYTVSILKNKGEFIEKNKVVVLQALKANAGKDVAIKKGRRTILSASGGNRYLWSTGETSQSIKVTAAAIGTKKYSVTVYKNGCTDTDIVKVTGISHRSKAEIAKGSDNILENEINQTMLVYPNPTSGILNIVLPNSNHDMDLVMMDQIGKIVFIDKVNANNSNQITKELNLSGLSKGIYFVKIYNDERNLTKKVIVN